MRNPVRCHSLRSLRHSASLAVLASAVTVFGTDPVSLAPLVVTATRDARPVADTPVSVDLFDGETLRTAPGQNVDDALRGSAAFGLFRRSGSLTANPTAQGVSLRGLGPSGASRALVLFDGIPSNDPFGGWVAWSKLPRLTLGGAEIVRGGGSGAWGNAALGGVVQILSASAANGDGAAAAELGAFTTRRAEIVSKFVAGNTGSLLVGARSFATDGFPALSTAQRGVIDRPLDSRHTLAHAGYAMRLAGDRQLDVGGRWFEEERGNGTPFQRNRSREVAGNLRFRGALTDSLRFDALAYAQRQHFASGFSAVATGRAAETPSLDQFDVPATAFGGALVVSHRASTTAETTFGADFRGVQGETNEDFLYSAGIFQRQRVAGGAQQFAGGLVNHHGQLAERLVGQVAARFDHWENTAGRRTETTKSTGAILRDDRFANRRGDEFSPSAGLVWHATDDLRFRLSGQRAFRLPTLNEYYRPFRVGTVNTEANPTLRRETATTGDAGFVYSRRAWEFSGGAFRSELNDAVANVTLSSTPALTSRQRLNLDEIVVRGGEAKLAWHPTNAFRLALDYLYSDARVTAATAAPGLVGKRLAQVPRHTATLQARWQPDAAWTFTTAARGTSAQFEDDENQLRLASAVVADLAVNWAFAPRTSLHLVAENLGGVRVETGRSADGLVSLGAPRNIRVGLERRW